jgi:hypothetical protein
VPAGRAGAAGSEYAPGAVELARRVVAVLGGRYSAELGIDVDAGDAEIERWFVAATLFGARIPARVAGRTFGLLEAGCQFRYLTLAEALPRNSPGPGPADRPGRAGLSYGLVVLDRTCPALCGIRAMAGPAARRCLLPVMNASP